MGHRLHRVCGGVLPFFRALEHLPIGQHLVGGVCLDGAEYMGVAIDHFLCHAVHHVAHGEAAPFLFNDAVEHHLHQNVAKLLAKIRGAVPVHGVQNLIGLLQKVPADGLMGLLGIPGAAAGAAEEPHDGEEILPIVTALTLKIYHTLSSFARNFSVNPLIFQGKFILSAKV